MQLVICFLLGSFFFYMCNYANNEYRKENEDRVGKWNIDQCVDIFAVLGAILYLRIIVYAIFG